MSSKQSRRRNSNSLTRRLYKFTNDLDLLHGSQSEQEYHHGADSLYNKSSELEADITKWFDSEYFDWRQPFYACLTPPGIPSTNDPQDNNNRLLKKFGYKTTTYDMRYISECHERGTSSQVLTLRKWEGPPQLLHAGLRSLEEGPGNGWSL
jgi:hypothetical protein